MDSSAQAEAALEYAIETHPGAEITVLHAYGIEDASVSRGAVIVLEDEVREAAKEHAETVFEQARDVATATGYEGEIGTVAKEGSPERVIPDYAAGTDVDAIVIGGHGRENPTRGESHPRSCLRASGGTRGPRYRPPSSSRSWSVRRPFRKTLAALHRVCDPRQRYCTG